MPVLIVSDLHKSYGDVKAVSGVSFSIDAGEIFGLLGPNGAGKTTTIGIIATLVAADRGQVEISGTGLSHAAAYKRKLGYVPQEISLNEKLTARENLQLFGRLYDLAGADLRHRVDDVLDAVGLADRADDLTAEFSGGMKRRLNIAAALLHEPELLLMDEPTAGVDPQARAYIFEIIERLADSGRAILYTTHYMEEAQRLCRRTAIIDHGRILAIGTLAELVRNLKARRELVIEAPGLTADVVARLAERLGWRQWVPDGDRVRFAAVESEHPLLEAASAARELGLRPTAIRTDEPNLETVFLELTGRALRD